MTTDSVIYIETIRIDVGIKFRFSSKVTTVGRETENHAHGMMIIGNEE